ncbi:MAG: 3-oxoacyl-[acyl-carrier-protein] synthase III C-terminal domain-containing protein, partial [Actinomycetes bacterium]
YNFGDGAAAMVMRAAANEGDESGADGGAGGGVLGGAIACVGGDHKPGMQIFGAGGTHAPIHRQLEAKRLIDLKVDVIESGRFTPHVITEAMRETLAATGLTADAVDLCVLPEGNAGYLTEELAEAGPLTPEWVGLEPKIFENLALVAATGSAAVPLALDHAWQTGAVKPGDRVMLLAIETSKWKYAGLAVRWTAAPPA